MVSKYVLVALAALMCCVVAEFTAKDLHTLNRLGDYAISPSNQVVYTVSQWDPSTNKTTSALYSEGRAITEAKKNRDSSPAFNPADSSVVFFSSTRSGGVSNLFVTNVDGSGTVAQVTNFPIDISNVIVTPSYIVFTAEIYDACGIDFECTSTQDNWWAANPNSGIVFDSLMVRHWDRLNMPGKSSQIFTLRYSKNANGVYSIPSGVKPIQLQAGLPRMNVPVPPNGGIEQLAVNTAAYDRIAFTGDLIAHDTAWSTGWQVYEAVVNPATGELTSEGVSCLTCDRFHKIRTTNPKYDPTGNYLAFLAMDRPGFEADRLHIELFKVGQRTPSPLTSHVDRSIADYTWTSDGKSIIAAFDEDGDERVYSFNLALGNTMNPILMNGTNAGLQVKGSTVFYTHTAYDTPADIRSFTFDTSTGKMIPGSDKKVTSLNPTFAQTFNLEYPTKFHFSSPASDGSSVQGWFFKPAGFDPSKKWPFVLLVHGGPQGAWNSGWSYRWNPQLWAQRGYAVAMINPHGSTGFGQSYCDMVSGNWGGIPFHDLMYGLNVVLNQYPWIDSNRLSACGASYGGFMINWFQGNAPTRFSSLVVHDGLYDVPISYGTTEELWFPEWEFKGTPWTNSSGYSVFNPARLADKWRTPMLVIHGGKDYRVDLAHGLAAFTTLQRKGIPSRFLFYPEENHWVSRPSNSVQWYSEVLGWLDTYTKNKSKKV